MQNQEIEKSKLESIAVTASEVVNIINKGVEWLDNYNNDSEVHSYELKKQRRIFNKIKCVITEKPSIALFGASQVGKSYMANNLLYNKSNVLLISDNLTNTEIDFLQKINPSGEGTESTSCVTRFTSVNQKLEGFLPVKIKIFSPKDIIIILCDTYYSDFVDAKGIPSKENIESLTNSFSALKAQVSHNFISEDDIYEIKEYLEKHFYNSSFIKSHLDNKYWLHFWDQLACHIQNLDIREWRNIFNILWNGHEEIGDLFNLCISELNKLNFSDYIYADFEVLYRNTVDFKGQQYPTSIINVKSLSIFFENIHSFQIQTQDKQKISITSSKLSLLCCEIILNVSPSSIENRPFINHSDIIDFPGARSRKEYKELSRINLIEMLLRGKVSYLFNLYSSSYKTNILCACMRVKEQSNVTVVPGILNKWIEENIGLTPEIRAANLSSQIPPLFIIFTWWNTQLADDFKTKPDPSDRLNKAFNIRYKEEIIEDYKWHKEWLVRNNEINSFSNFYLLRDFDKSKDIFSSSDQGEYEIKQDQQNYYSKFKDEFLQYHKNKNLFFRDPLDNFNESSTPNKDGSELIIRMLSPIASNNNSVPIFINTLKNSLNIVRDIFENNYHDDNDGELINLAMEQSSKIVIIMNNILGMDAYRFGYFIEKLLVSEREIFELFHDLLQKIDLVYETRIKDIILFRQFSPDLLIFEIKPDNDKIDEIRENNIKILQRDYHFKSAEETKAYFKLKKIDTDEIFFGDCLPNRSDLLAREASQLWFNKMKNTDNFSYFIEKGFDKSLLEELLNKLKKCYDEKLNVSKIIARKISDYVDVGKKIDNAEEMIAHISSAIINEFVISSGYSYIPDGDKELLQKTNISKALNLKFPKENEVFESLTKLIKPGSNKMSLEKLLEFMVNLNDNLNKIPLDIKTMEYVPMIKNYSRWREFMKISFLYTSKIPTYDVAGNRKMGEIRNELEKYKFNNL